MNDVVYICGVYQCTMNASSPDTSSGNRLVLGGLDTSGYVFISTAALMYVTALCTNLAMGCTIKPQDLSRQLSTLGGMVAGAAMQYVFFPATAFVTSHVMSLPASNSVAMILMASCPGSSLTALLTYYINGDVYLSLCISAICCAVSIGLAPAILFMYTRSWTYVTLHISLWPVAYTLVLHIIPPVVGHLIRRKSSVGAWVIEKICTVVGLLSFITECILQLVAHSSKIWLTSGRMAAVIVLLPWLGWAMAYLLAWLFKQNVFKRRTICAEILVHNVSLALVILGTTFHSFRHKPVMGAVLSLSNSVNGLNALLVAIVYNLRPPWEKSGDEGLLRVREQQDDPSGQDNRGATGISGADAEDNAKKRPASSKRQVVSETESQHDDLGIVRTVASHSTLASRGTFQVTVI